MKMLLSLAMMAVMVFSVYCSEAVAEQAVADTEYTISVIPFYSPEKIWSLYDPFVQQLKKTTGLPWALKLYPDHESLLKDICGGRVGVALLGPVPMGRVNASCSAEPVVVAIGKDGEPYYQSVIITSDPSVKTIEDLRGRSFGLFKGSTAAHILPLKMLRQAGLEMNAIEAKFYESQDKIMSALLAGELKAAGVKETLYRKFQKENLRVLQTSGDLPNFAFVALPSWPQKARSAFVSALMKLKPRENAADAETVKSWDEEVKYGFVTPDREFMPAVKKLAETYAEIINAPK